jgi:hypothetical protein
MKEATGCEKTWGLLVSDLEAYRLRLMTYPLSLQV